MHILRITANLIRFALESRQFSLHLKCSHLDTGILAVIKRIGVKLRLEIEQKHKQKASYSLIIRMDKSTGEEESFPHQEESNRPKLSIATIYPIELPKIKFYTERAIHQDPDESKKNSKQIPVTFIRYLKNKEKKRYSSLNEGREVPSKEKTHHESMYITNSLEKQRKQRNFTLHIDNFRCKTQTTVESFNLQSLMQKSSMPLGKQREQKSNILLNYYKKKYLKYKCRKSIDLDDGKGECFKYSIKNINLLADGLKIEKIGILDTPKNNKELINRAKFNTLGDSKGSGQKRWEIGPWNFKTQCQGFQI